MTASWSRNPRPRKFVRDFHRQRYGNPLFPRLSSSRPSRPSFRSRGGAKLPKGAIALATVGLLAAFGAWYAIWSPALRVKDVEIVGATPATEEAVRKAIDGYADGHAMLIFPRDNVLLFSESGARVAIEAAVFLDGVDIRKKLPDTVTVTIREKTIKAAMELGGRLHGLDESGFVVRELAGKEVAQMHDLPPGFNMVGVEGLGAESMDVPDAPKDAKADPAKEAEAKAKALKESKNVWPLIIDKRTPDPRKDRRKPGTQAFSATTVGLVLQANARLPDVTGEAIRWFVPDEASDSVDALMAGEWHVYLATATPLDVQADRLGLVLKEKVGARRADLEYVDLRYNERIFYRLKDAIQ